MPNHVLTAERKKPRPLKSAVAAALRAPPMGELSKPQLAHYTSENKRHMDFVAIHCPTEFELIIESIRKRSWIITPFDADEGELYNPAEYFYNEKVDGINYKLIVDRNLFSFILAAAQKCNVKKIYRDAIALIVFCQVAGILIEPNMAVYEKIDFDRNNADEAVEELKLFYRIDNTRSEDLLAYVLGISKKFSPIILNNIDLQEIKSKLLRHEWLAEWKSLYLIVLHLVYISEQKIDNKDKMESFISWMVKDFRLSLVSIVYAIFLFSSIRMKKMVKYKRTDSPQLRRKQLTNMTWDLFFANNFFRKWIGKANTEEYLLATDDKMVQELLKKAIYVQKEQDIAALSKYLHQNEVSLLKQVLFTINNTKDRVYNSEDWSLKYRDELIFEKEKLLLS